MTCQSDIFGGVDHHIRNRAALEARRSIGQHPGRDTADRPIASAIDANVVDAR